MARTGKRITRVTTKAGDAGTTTLADGSKIAKIQSLMHAIGDVDELNSVVGLLATEIADDDPLRSACTRLQQELFDLGAHLATVGMVPCPELAWLEELIAALNDALPALTEFVIPGGTKAAALAHVCRTTCRRAERSLWALADEASHATDATDTTGTSAASAKTDSVEAARYANRLSDLLFVMARTLNAQATPDSEPQWRGSQR
jgi:cob(I)alamin adenosyltransferase